MWKGVLVRQRRLERFKIFVFGNGRELFNGNAHEIKAASLMLLKCFERGDPDSIRRFLAVLDALGHGRRLAHEKSRIESSGSARWRGPAVVEVQFVDG